MHGDAIEEILVFLRSIVVIWLCKNVCFFIFLYNIRRREMSEMENSYCNYTIFDNRPQQFT